MQRQKKFYQSYTAGRLPNTAEKQQKCHIQSRIIDNLILYLGQEEPVAANVDMHFPIPGEHMELEDH